MFNNCTSLTSAPLLPASTLVDFCYSSMFAFCGNLSYIKCLATNFSADGPTIGFTYGVSPTGTFVKKSGANWNTGNNGIPSGWTVIEE